MEAALAHLPGQPAKQDKFALCLYVKFIVPASMNFGAFFENQWNISSHGRKIFACQGKILWN